MDHHHKRLLNVGCGANVHPDFVNIDYDWRPGIDLTLDITQGIKVPDGSAEGIFTEHCLEHITAWQCGDVMKDFFRILRPGGVLRVIVPDGGLYLKLYQDHQAGADVSFPYIDNIGATDLAEDSKFGFTPMMAVNRIFRGYGHVMAYDFETLRNIAAHAGFADIRHEVFRQGRDHRLLIDSELRRPQSLYVEAVKPS